MAALDGPDFETTRQQLAAFGANRDPDLGTSAVEFLGEQAGALAQHAQSVQESIGRASADWPPSSDSSDQGLNDAAEAIGLSNGAGGYGRRGRAAAAGATGQLTGDKGTTYTAGQLAQGPGGVRLKLRSTVSIPAGTGTGQVLGTWDVDSSDANSLGAKGNLLTGVTCTLLPPPAGSDSTFVLTSNYNGYAMSVQGQNAETGPALLIRIQNKQQRPPNGGNGTDYKGWAEDARDTLGNPVTTLQVLGWVFPHYFGVGSPMVCLTAPGPGLSRDPEEDIRAAVEEFINGSTTREGQRPASHDCTVLRPWMPDSRMLIIRCRCVPSLAKFAFDWQRESSALTINNIANVGLPAFVTAAGGNLFIELDGPVVGTGTAPLSLKDAITAGSKPRLYVNALAGGTIQPPVVPEQAECLAYLDAAGKTGLALKVVNAATFPGAIGDEVYSGGPIVAKVAAAILAAVDELGPSRRSGLYDPAQVWRDRIGIANITGAALQSLDDDQLTPLVGRCITSGAAANVSHIRIGAAGAAQLEDVQAIDTTVFGPELLRAGRVLVTD